MRYLLDTDHISIIQRRSGEPYRRLRDRMGRFSATDFAVCVVSFHEQSLGANDVIQKARKPLGIVSGYGLFSEIVQAFSLMPVLDMNVAAAERFELLRSQRVRIGTMDLRIASICLSEGLVLLSRNRKDFEQVPDLIVEDWTV
jgi:tRNA(fMet)-specific endonuclease VapC